MISYHYYEKYDWKEQGFYVVVLDTGLMFDELKKARNWCYQTFGSPGYQPDTYLTRWDDSIPINGMVRFAKEEDYTTFLLRWT